MIPRELVEDAKQQASKLTGIPKANMLISATHTHSAPTLGSVFQSNPDPDYTRFLAAKIAQGIDRANKNLAPAKIGWGVGKDPTQLFNRRWKREQAFMPQNPFGENTDQVQMNPGHLAKGLIEPAGPIDPDVSIIAVQSKSGKPLALLANYSLHYVGGNPDLSADYFGAFAERIATLLGQDSGNGPFVGIMSNGTSGDVNNVNFAGVGTMRKQGEQIRIVADSVAKAAFEAYKNIKFHDHVSLAVAEKDILLGVRKPSEADLQRAREILAKAKNPKQLSGLAEVYARETVMLAKFPDTVTAKIQAMRIGEMGIAAIPCEVFTEIGLEIKKKSPLQPTCTIELANGYNGYLPTPGQHKLGGYETWRARSSYLEVKASEKITETVLDLLKRVAK